VENYQLLEGLQLQARNDTLLALLSKFHGKGLKILHLACTEEVTTDAIMKLLNACPFLVNLSLYFYDGHILDENLMQAVRGISSLKKLWLGTLPTAMVEPIRIVHDGLELLLLKELNVKRVDIECPKVTVLVPPLHLQDLENAYELYARGYPKDFVVRVAEGNRLDCIKVRPTDTVAELIEQIQRLPNKPNAMSVIVNGRALKRDQKCADCLKNGSVVKLLC